jgi:branched-chain amino acid transport system ATP-binding protein
MKGTRAGDISIEGTVCFAEERIDVLAPHQIVMKGLVHCPERARVFPEMTVADNLKAGAYLCRDGDEARRNLEEVYQLFPTLKDRGNQISGTLSGGERQMLAIGRALMVSPRLLCIDEPSTGLSTKLKTELFERIGEIKRSGIAVLLVEQDVGSAFQLASRSYVLSHGRVIAEGTGEELLQDETIRRTYLTRQVVRMAMFCSLHLGQIFSVLSRNQVVIPLGMNSNTSITMKARISIFASCGT